MGNPSWSANSALPYFKKLENDLDFQNERHGDAGPLPIKRDPTNDQTLVHQAFLAASTAVGHPFIADLNGSAAAGIGPIPKNVVDGVRQSTALTYLAAARSRANLEVMCDALVDRVLFDGDKATAVQLADSRGQVDARTIIIAAGAFLSPAVLMRSGLRPRTHLEQSGVDCLLDLPGIGQNLSDHPLLRMRFRSNTSPGDRKVSPQQIVLRLRSKQSSYEYDLHALPSPFSYEDDGELVFRITVSLLKPHSRGSVTLASRNCREPPIIDMAYYSNPDDMPRMIDAVRSVRQICEHRSMSNLIDAELYPGPSASSDDVLEERILAETRTDHHPVGTCSMGPEDNPNSVVNELGRVYGVHGLYVIDASIMPTVPAANTNLPTIMLAERCADSLLEVA